MIEQAFEVATEFKFEIGQALISSDALRSSVDQLSQSADSAMTSLNYLAGGLIARLGFGSGGLLSLLKNSVELSEQFNVGTMGFINTISSNTRVLGGHIHGFNEQLETSRMLMESIRGTAGKLGLNPSELAQYAQTFTTPMAARGRAGTNFSESIALAKNTMLAGEITGIGHGAAQEQILRALNVGQGFAGKIFERLINTNSFRAAHVFHPSQGSMMNPDKKMDLITKAMKELGGSAEFLAFRANMLSVQFEILKYHVSNILKPIGDALLVPIKKIVSMITDYFTKSSGNIGKSIAMLIDNVFKNPQDLFKNIFQLKNASNDLHKAFKFTRLVQDFLFLKWVLGLVGISIPNLASLARSGLTFVFDALKSVFSFFWRMGVFGDLFVLLLNVLSTVIPYFAAFMMLFQGISRAKGAAMQTDIKVLPEIAPQLAKSILMWKIFIQQVLSPFQVIIDEIASAFEPIFRKTTYLKEFIWITELMAQDMIYWGNSFVDLAADVHGFFTFLKTEIAYLLRFPSDLMHALTSRDFASEIKNLIFNTDASDGWANARADFIQKNAARLGKVADSTSNAVVTNNNSITARFDMREQMEPDRIAFSVVEHLKKMAINPRQSSGGSFHAAFGTPKFAGDN